LVELWLLKISKGTSFEHPLPRPKTENEKTEEHSLLLLHQEEQPFLHVPWQWKEGRDPASIIFAIHEEEKHSNRTKKLKNILIKSNQSSSLKLCFEKKQQQQQEEEESGMPSIPKFEEISGKKKLSIQLNISLFGECSRSTRLRLSLLRKKERL
jgi:hypothetical protein